MASTRALTKATEAIPARPKPTLRELQNAFNAVNRAWGLRMNDIGRVRLHRVLFTGGWRVSQLDEYGADNYITPVLTRTEALSVLENMHPGAGPVIPSAAVEAAPAESGQNYCDADYEETPWDVRDSHG